MKKKNKTYKVLIALYSQNEQLILNDVLDRFLKNVCKINTKSFTYSENILNENISIYDVVVITGDMFVSITSGENKIKLDDFAGKILFVSGGDKIQLEYAKKYNVIYMCDGTTTAGMPEYEYLPVRLSSIIMNKYLPIYFKKSSYSTSFIDFKNEFENLNSNKKLVNLKTISINNFFVFMKEYFRKIILYIMAVIYILFAIVLFYGILFQSPQ